MQGAGLAFAVRYACSFLGRSGQTQPCSVGYSEEDAVPHFSLHPWHVEEGEHSCISLIRWSGYESIYQPRAKGRCGPSQSLLYVMKCHVEAVCVTGYRAKLLSRCETGCQPVQEARTWDCLLAFLFRVSGVLWLFLELAFCRCPI